MMMHDGEGYVRFQVADLSYTTVEINQRHYTTNTLSVQNKNNSN
jgi:hypothetical protein